MSNDCEELAARAEMLHQETRLSLAKALDAGPRWVGFKDQLAIADRLAEMASRVEHRIEEEC